MLYDQAMTTIFKEYTALESHFNGSAQVNDSLSVSTKDIFNRIIHISMDRLINPVDEEGKELPFYNISNYAVDVAVRATEFDSKDIILESEEPEFVVHSLIATKLLDNWKKEARFGSVINDMIKKRPRWGGVLVKRFFDEGTVHVEVVNWLNLVFHQNDIENNPIAEKHQLNINDFYEKKEVWNGGVGRAIEILEKKKGSLETLSVIEMEGVFSNEYIGKGEGYSLQRHFFVKDGGVEIVLDSTELTDGSNYKYLSWDERENLSIGFGEIQKCFESQASANRSKAYEEAMLKLGTITRYWTDDPEFEDVNVHDDTTQGELLKLSKGSRFGQVAQNLGNISATNNSIESAKEQIRTATSTPSSLTGHLPSGVAFRSIATAVGQARSRFDILREDFGFFITEILEDWILPHEFEKMTKKDLLKAGFSGDELRAINEQFGRFEANQALVQRILDDEEMTQDEYEETIASAGELLNEESFMNIPKNFFKDVRLKIKIITTGESEDLETFYSNASQLLQILAGNPDLLEDPRLSKITHKIIEKMGFSPLSFGKGGKVNTKKSDLAQLEQLSAGTTGGSMEISNA